MAAAQRDAHLAVGFEAADARPMAGPRVDDDEGAQLGVHRRVAFGRLDADQGVVHRPGQAAAVDDRVVLEEQHRRAAGLLMFDEIVAGLPHDIPEHHQALGGVGHIGLRVLRQGGGGAGEGVGCLPQAGHGLLGVRGGHQRGGVAADHVGHVAHLVQHPRRGLAGLIHDFPGRDDGRV